MNAIRSNNVSLKYQRFTPYGCKDIGFTNTEFVAKTQFQIGQGIHKLNRTYQKQTEITTLYITSLRTRRCPGYS